MVNLTSELAVWITLFIFGLFFEGWVITHPLPARWAWLEPLVRAVAPGLGITTLMRGYQDLPFEDIIRHVWLPLLFAIGPAIAFQIIKYSQDTQIARQEADQFNQQLNKVRDKFDD